MRKSITALLITLLLLPLHAASQEKPGERRKKEEAENSKELNYEMTKTIEFEQKLGGCEAKIEFEYWQKGPQVFVKSSLDTPDCAAASGDYTIQVRYRDDQGETTTDKYDETWERSDDKAVKVTKQYEIEKNMELRSVRSMGLSCECVEE